LQERAAGWSSAPQGKRLGELIDCLCKLRGVLPNPLRFSRVTDGPDYANRRRLLQNLVNTVGKRSNNQSVGVQPEKKIERRPVVQDAFVGREDADSKPTRPSVAASLPRVRYDLERMSLAVFSQYRPQVRAVFQQVDPAACAAFVAMERIQ
jgi:hypothetical protein